MIRDDVGLEGGVSLVKLTADSVPVVEPLVNPRAGGSCLPIRVSLPHE